MATCCHPAECKSSVAAPDSDGRTALHLAVLHGHPDAVRSLLDAGMAPSTPDNNGQTPLHIAAQGSSPEIVNLLLQKDKAGASCSARDNHGRTAVFYAYSNPCLDVLARFLSFVPVCGTGCALTPEIVLKSNANISESSYFAKAPCGPAATAKKCCVKSS